MLARVELCTKLLQMEKKALYRYLARMFWIDSKTFYIEPGARMVWAPEGADMTVVDERMPRTRKHVKKIVYYAVVNALAGPVYIEYMTGTTGHDQDVMRPPWSTKGIPVSKDYKVRHPILLTAHTSWCR